MSDDRSISTNQPRPCNHHTLHLTPDAGTDLLRRLREGREGPVLRHGAVPQGEDALVGVARQAQVRVDEEAAAAA